MESIGIILLRVRTVTGKTVNGGNDVYFTEVYSPYNDKVVSVPRDWVENETDDGFVDIRMMHDVWPGSEIKKDLIGYCPDKMRYVVG